jgi:hypothetical protein
MALNVGLNRVEERAFAQDDPGVKIVELQVEDGAVIGSPGANVFYAQRWRKVPFPGL